MTEEYHPNWVSVEDRLPATSGTLMVAFDDGYLGFAYYEKASADFEFSTLSMQNVTHWALLPKHPLKD